MTAKQRHENRMNAKQFTNFIWEIFNACDAIKDADMCHECPCMGTCLDEATFIEVCDIMPYDTFEELIEMGERPTFYPLSDDEKLEIIMQNL